MVALGSSALMGACSSPSCLGGDCAATAPCGALTFSCATPSVWAGAVADAPAGLDLRHAQGAAGDTLLTNGVVTAVFGAIDAPIDLAPTGGNLIDFGPSGGDDDLTILYQLAGILPDDAFAYRSLTVEDHAPDYVAVVVRGALDGRPDVDVVTRWELHACDPGLRVRTELWNRSPDPHAWFVADAAHWGKRRVVPFAPKLGQGFAQPELDLLELSSEWSDMDYAAGATAATGATAYADLACSSGGLHGVNDLEISALGTDTAIVRPGDTVVFERFVVAAPAQTALGAGGVASAVGPALTARTQIFGVESPVPVTGVIRAGGAPFGGDVRRASILIGTEDPRGFTPLTSVIAGADGAFTAQVPSRPGLAFEVWSFGRVVARGLVPSDGVIGDVVVSAPATLQVAVTDQGGPISALAVLVPADDATRAATTGTYHGRFEPCAPWLGPPTGASPACDRALIDAAGSELEVPAGHYIVIATAGPAHTLAKQEVTLVGGEITAIDLTLASLDVAPAGWLGADLHVHGRASFDSGLPDDDRVRSFVAQGVDVIAATDHDYVTDYAATVASLGVGDRIAVLGGLETTQLIPWLDVPGEDVPRVIGHFNFWPITPSPASPRGGAPWDERIEPGELFDRMAPLVGDGGLMQINHPWDEPTFGRDLGYLRAIKFDPRAPIPATDDGTANGALVRAPAGGHRNLDWNAFEVQNGAGADEYLKARGLWFALLSQGYVVAGTGNSDSHGLRDNQLGWARNWVDAGTSVVGFDRDRFDAAVRDGRLVAGSGVVIAVTIGPASGARRGLGFTPVVPASGDVVDIEVRAAPWIPVDEVRVVTSRGTRVIASGAMIAQPPDPWGAGGVVRWHGQLAASELVEGDDWIVIEAGLPLPISADLDDDGVPDTTDNNGDGVVDRADVEPDEDTGPVANPPDPIDPADRRWPMTRAVPLSWPIGFTSPLLIDVDGDGWTPPGLR